MKKQIRKLLHRFENLKFRKKLSVLMLIAGLVPVGFLAFSMQYGMMNQLREKEQYNLEKMLEQSLRISLRSMRTWLIICLILKISGIFLMWRQSRIMRSI